MCAEEFITPACDHEEPTYLEVRIYEYNDIDRKWEVDAWLTDDPNEEERIVARIDPFTNEVTYTEGLDVNPRKCPLVQETIKVFIEGEYCNLPMLEELQPHIKDALTALNKVTEILSQTKVDEATEGIVGRIFGALYAVQEYDNIISEKLKRLTPSL